MVFYHNVTKTILQLTFHFIIIKNIIFKLHPDGNEKLLDVLLYNVEINAIIASECNYVHVHITCDTYK